jgi:hypothetical protein
MENENNPENMKLYRKSNIKEHIYF